MSLAVESSDVPTMGRWWDIYWWAVWEGQETLRAELREQGIAGIAKKDAKKALREHDKGLKKRKPFQERFHKQMRGFFGDTPAPAFAYGGLSIDGAGGVRFTGKKVEVLLVNTLTGDRVEMTDRQEVEATLNFILFYRSQAVGDGGESEDPDAFVRAILESKGITAANYWTHPKSPKDMINCPFPEAKKSLIVDPTSEGA